MHTYRINRTGQVPLTFTGELLAAVDGQWAAGIEQTRWHNLTLYITAGGQYVLQVEYRTLWDNELDHWWAALAEPADFADVLASYDAAADVHGFGDRPHQAKRQAEVQGEVVRRYEAQVTALLAEATALHEKVE